MAQFGRKPPLLTTPYQAVPLSADAQLSSRTALNPEVPDTPYQAGPLTPVPPPKRRRGRFSAIALIIVLLIAWLALSQRQAIYDWLKLYDYTPPASVAALASDDQLTASATHIFYVNHPQVDSKTTFASKCPSGSAETAVLGCYVSNQQGIYLLSVTDSRLNGIEQVTAAHEMLHAAYDRLDDNTRQQVDGWLMDYYNHGLTERTIKQQLDSYRQSEPNDLVNEMHSIFGTEVGSLPANLENYYKRYFNDRSKITGYYQQYEAAFTSRIDLANKLYSEIKDLEQQINAKRQQLDSELSTLRNEQASLNSQQQVNNYNALVNQYNANVRSFNQLVNTHNSLVGQYKSVALEEQQLTQDITTQSTVSQQ